MAKPFYYRINAAELLHAVITTPEEERGSFILTLALDLVSGVPTNNFSKQIIREAKAFSKAKSEAGIKGMQNRYLKSNTVITEPNTVITKKHSVITRNSTETVTEEETLPRVIPSQEWDEFLLHRAKIKKPMSDLARSKMIHKLVKHHEEGYDVSKLLDRAIVNGWQDIYPDDGCRVRAGSAEALKAARGGQPLC